MMLSALWHVFAPHNDYSFKKTLKEIAKYANHELKLELEIIHENGDRLTSLLNRYGIVVQRRQGFRNADSRSFQIEVIESLLRLRRIQLPNGPKKYDGMVNKVHNRLFCGDEMIQAFFWWLHPVMGHDLAGMTLTISEIYHSNRPELSALRKCQTLSDLRQLSRRYSLPSRLLEYKDTQSDRIIAKSRLIRELLQMNNEKQFTEQKKASQETRVITSNQPIIKKKARRGQRN